MSIGPASTDHTQWEFEWCVCCLVVCEHTRHVELSCVSLGVVNKFQFASTCAKRKEKIEKKGLVDLFVGYFMASWAAFDKFTRFKRRRSQLQKLNLVVLYF